MKKFFYGFLFLLLTAGLISCGASGGGSSSGNSKIVGTWESVEYYFAGEKTDRTVSVTFNKDGTAQTGMGEGTYVVDGNSVTFTSNKGNVDILFELQDDGTLKTENPATKIIYQKK